MSRPQLLIYLADLVHNYFPGNYVVPLNIGYIAAHANAEFGTDIEIRLFKYPEALIKAIKKDPPHILGLSNYDWNLSLNRAVGEWYKKVNSGGHIIAGGPNIRVDREGIRQFLAEESYIDAYTMFQGELPFANFVRHILERQAFDRESVIGGCAYFAPGGGLVFEPVSYGRDLHLSSPYLSGLLDPFLEDKLIPLLETNRGCPYSCTFCTWGISALSKVAQHPLNQVFDEIDYVAQRSASSSWIFADANFGILKRDLDIAGKLGEAKGRNKALRQIILWDAKNNGAKNLEISKKIDDSTESRLVALQSLDPAVLKAIKRDNIKTEELLYTVAALKKEGIAVFTDILVGLPAETYESHLETLRKCFDIGFDFMLVRHVILLKGSEMETEECRQQYAIRGKYRLKQGSYGVYDGIAAFEFEESPRSTSTMSAEELSRIRLLHWLIYWGWNSTVLKSLLLFLWKRKGVNPLDIFLHIMQGNLPAYPDVARLFDDIIKDSDEEWFESKEAITHHYKRKEHFEKLLDVNTTFSKLVFKYMAVLIYKRPLFLSFLNYVEEICSAYVEPGEERDILADLTGLARESCLDLGKGIQGAAVRKTIKLRDRKTLQYIFAPEECADSSFAAGLDLYLNSGDILEMEKMFATFDFTQRPLLAIEKTLEMFPAIFTYKSCVPAR